MRRFLLLKLNFLTPIEFSSLYMWYQFRINDAGSIFIIKFLCFYIIIFFEAFKFFYKALSNLIYPTYDINTLGLFLNNFQLIKILKK